MEILQHRSSIQGNCQPRCFRARIEPQSFHRTAAHHKMAIAQKAATRQVAKATQGAKPAYLRFLKQNTVITGLGADV